jgi:Holliday junction resolvase RusA-like endonuclease
MPKKIEAIRTIASIVVRLVPMTDGYPTRKMSPISFVVPTEAKSLQSSGRKVMCKGGRAVFYKSQDAKAWIKVVGFYANPHVPAQYIQGPISLSLTFVMKRPVALNGKKFNQGRIPFDKRPDTDNLCKGFTDALVGFWMDDSQITELHASKYYAAKGEMPKIEVTIKQINTSNDDRNT